MKILVLGGTRFFGMEFARQRAAGGDRVTVFSRRAPVEDLPPSITQLCGERRNAGELRELALTRWDAVVDNLCFTGQDASAALEAFAGRTGIYVMVSSGDVHLALKNAQSPFDEDMAGRLPENPAARETQPYGWGKREAEKIFRQAAIAADFPACAVRFPIVIGPGEPKLRAYSYWLRLADGGPVVAPDGGLNYRRYIYSGDAARALSLLVDHPGKSAGETFHFGDTVPVTLREWLEMSADILETRADIAAVPAGWLERNGFDIAAASPFSHPENYVLGISKAEDLFGWQSTPRRKWLEQTIHWYFHDYHGPRPENYAARAAETALVKKFNGE
ncbi:MAG: NAD-dependent epimerase/dehydratase family protein [Elusimicrobiales bacterium]